MSDDESSDGTGYLIGLTFIAGAIFAFFLLWCFVIAICKCCSKGILGGKPCVLEPVATEEATKDCKEAEKSGEEVEQTGQEAEQSGKSSACQIACARISKTTSAR